MGFWSKVGGAGKKIVTAPVDGAKKLMNIEEAKGNLVWMGRILRTLSPSSVKAGRVETFDHAMKRQNVSEDDLAKIFMNHFLKFWIGALFLVTGLIVVGNYLLEGQLIALLPGFGFGAICLSQMFAASFRAYQISQRRFCDVADWVGKPSVWVLLTYDLPPVVKQKPNAGSSVSKVKRAASTSDEKAKD